jgi:hypothetical protein
MGVCDVSTTAQELDEFSAFARKRIAAGATVELVELAAEWAFRHETNEQLLRDTEAVRIVLEAVDSGSIGRSLEAFDRDFRQRNHIA